MIRHALTSRLSRIGLPMRNACASHSLVDSARPQVCLFVS